MQRKYSTTPRLPSWRSGDQGTATVYKWWQAEAAPDTLPLTTTVAGWQYTPEGTAPVGSQTDNLPLAVSIPAMTYTPLASTWFDAQFFASSRGYTGGGSIVDIDGWSTSDPFNGVDAGDTATTNFFVGYSKTSNNSLCYPTYSPSNIIGTGDYANSTYYERTLTPPSPFLGCRVDAFLALGVLDTGGGDSWRIDLCNSAGAIIFAARVAGRATGATIDVGHYRNSTATNTATANENTLYRITTVLRQNNTADLFICAVNTDGVDQGSETQIGSQVSLGSGRTSAEVAKLRVVHTATNSPTFGRYALLLNNLTVKDALV